ncbi:hypothetical protein ACH4NC_27480 [Streptomyces sp. NPDC017201]|uniref:BACON domain-containing protein n=1 Tax=unclassified Streptomyces TaxID=2593676 RepID=UPI002E280472|nr:hypothetical protein [Streptomyces sp. NBC_01422]WSS62648.1 hypothetical protein OG284_16095 [Streptomyces sp. NBC_01177]
MSESAVRLPPESAYGRHVTSSRLETPTHTTGAHRAHRREARPTAQRSSARHEPYLDGLFTYCLSVLCDHEAATEALGSVLAIAERQDGRCPAAEEERKSWLYALARWTCLRALTEQRRGRQAHRRGPAPRGTAPREGVRAPRTHAPQEEAGCTAESPAAEAHRRELAQLAWPEAAGTTPEQREALELAVRHGLTPRAVAAVLGLDPAGARELLAAGACEVERTRAALAVVETGDCPAVARLTGAHQVLLSAALRRELVRHVDDCPRCRRAAERAGAAGPWPGAAVTPAAAALPVVEAPRPSVHVALTHARRSRSGAPRFGRTGFPLDPKDHAARRDRLRARVLTTTVVATVVAAPVIALWAAYRGAPLTGEGRGTSVTASDVDGESGTDDPYDHYENAGNARPEGDDGFADDGRSPDVSAEVVSVGAGPDGASSLAVSARSSGGRTTITLTATGDRTVVWSARADAPWLRLSRTSGTVAPGRSVTLHVFVDHAAEPRGPWSARVLLTPSGSAVAITGHGATVPRPGSPRPSPDPSSGTPDPTPTSPSPSTDPTPGPTDPTDPTDPTGPPDPTPTDPPTDPTPSPSDGTTSPSPTSGATAEPGEPSGPAG